MTTYTRPAIAALVTALVLLVTAGTASAGFGQMGGYGTPGPEASPWANITVDCSPDGFANLIYDYGNTGDAATTITIHTWEPDGVVQQETLVGPNSVHQYVHAWTENHPFSAYVMNGASIVESIETVIDCDHVAPTVTLDTECPHFGFTLHNNDGQWAHFAATIDGVLNGAFPVVAPLTSMPYIVAGVEDVGVHVVIEGARAPGEPLVVLFDEVLTMDCMGDPVQWPEERPDTKPVRKPGGKTVVTGGLVTR